MRKFTVIVVVALIMALVLPQAVMAAVLEVDTASPMFKADTWQNRPDNDEVCPLIKAFEITPMPSAGASNDEVHRYAGCVNVNESTLDDESEAVVINGSVTTSVVFPFKETVNLEQITWKWNNGTRQYFFFAYTSTDGVNWTEIGFTSANIRKGTALTTYDEFGSADGPAVENIWVSHAAGNADSDNDVLPITFAFEPSGPANYLKFTFYGNDNGADSFEIAQPWISFNNLIIEGTVAAADAPAAAVIEDTGAAAADADVPAAAPAVVAERTVRTGDAGMIALIALMAIAALSIVVLRRKISVR